MIAINSPLPWGERSSGSEAEGAYELTSWLRSPLTSTAPLTPALSPWGRGAKFVLEAAE